MKNNDTTNTDMPLVDDMTPFDPSAILFGVHMFIAQRPREFVRQAVLGILACVCLAVYVQKQTAFLQQCCYRSFPPSAATLAAFGSCADPLSLASRQNPTCINAVPALNIALLFISIVAFIADVALYMITYRMYRRGIASCIASSSLHYNRVVMMMVMPVTGFLLSSYELLPENISIIRHASHRWKILYYIRHFLLYVGVYIVIDVMVELYLNYAWGCYQSFHDSSDGDVYELTKGRCDIDGTRINKDTDGGHFRVWDSSLTYYYVGNFVLLVWLGLFIVRLIGWHPYINSLPHDVSIMLHDQTLFKNKKV